MTNPGDRMIGKCKHCKTVNVGAVKIAGNYSGHVQCTNCGKMVMVQAITGGTGKAHKCGAKCTNATGFICDCECRGENHGSAHHFVGATC